MGTLCYLKVTLSPPHFQADPDRLRLCVPFCPSALYTDKTYAKHFFSSCRRLVTLGDLLLSLWTDDETLTLDRRHHFLNSVRRSILQTQTRVCICVCVWHTLLLSQIFQFVLFISLCLFLRDSFLSVQRCFCLPHLPDPAVSFFHAFVCLMVDNSCPSPSLHSRVFDALYTFTLNSFETQKLSAVFLKVKRNVSHPSLQTPCLLAAHRPSDAWEHKREELLKSTFSIRDPPGNKVIFTK